VSNLDLIVGTNSTWSIRAWLCLKLANLEFNEIVISLEKDNYQSKIAQYSNAMLVPVLVDNDIHIHDSLAITEYVNDITPIYPNENAKKALARSLCAELHSGFMSLRANCPFSFEKVAPAVLTEPLNKEIVRLTHIFKNAHGHFMFETASPVDAFYAVLAFRLSAYGIELEGKAGEYQTQLQQWPLFTHAIAAAKTWNNHT
jgi:glutathione S-transferase